jgi:hypothetical protein
VRSNYTKPTLANTQVRNSNKPLNVASPEYPAKELPIKDDLRILKEKTQNLESYNGLRNVLSPPDPITDNRGRIFYQLPEGTFGGGHGAIALTATKKDGSPLPDWIKFEGTTGKIIANVPKDIKIPFEIKVEATDSRGDKAETTFKILPRPNNMSFSGKHSLSSQFKSAFDLIA